jgi:predicted DNA-binding protein
MLKISLTITPELAKFVTELASETGKTEADIVRQALSFYTEEQAVQKVLLAAKEPSLDTLLN